MSQKQDTYNTPDARGDGVVKTAKEARQGGKPRSMVIVLTVSLVLAAVLLATLAYLYPVS